MAGYCLPSPLTRAGVVLLAVTLLQLTTGSPYNSGHRAAPPRTCGELGQCCQGQNNTCFVFGPRMDRSTDSRRCYCDSNCLIMGDCCTDYHHSCRSQDCSVGEWEEWTECDNQCGYGTRRRYRRVRVYPDNGGQKCPVLKQRRACVGYKQEICQQNMLEQQEEERNEKARILPSMFGQARGSKEFNPWTHGILKNLNKFYNEIPTKASYSGKFRITKTHYGCAEESADWAQVLKVNATVCVECQPVAMDREMQRCLGHGVYRTTTTWKAVDVAKCHGEWELIAPFDSEPCHYSVVDQESKNFIFI